MSSQRAGPYSPGSNKTVPSPSRRRLQVNVSERGTKHCPLLRDGNRNRSRLPSLSEPFYFSHTGQVLLSSAPPGKSCLIGFGASVWRISASFIRHLRRRVDSGQRRGPAATRSLTVSNLWDRKRSPRFNSPTFHLGTVEKWPQLVLKRSTHAALKNLSQRILLQT